MTLAETIGAIFLVLSALGWAKAFERAFALRNADIAQAWQHRYVANEYVAPRGNRRVS